MLSFSIYMDVFNQVKSEYISRTLYDERAEISIFFEATL